MLEPSDYRTAIKVAEELGLPTDYLDAALRGSEKFHVYAQQLGQQIHHTSYSTLVAGMKAITTMLKDGWTPPEGLF